MHAYAPQPLAAIRETFDQVYDAYFKEIVGWCSYKLRNNSKGEDVAQQAFLKYYQYMTKGNQIEKPRSLLYRLANNIMIDEYRKEKNRMTLSLEAMYENGHDVGKETLGTIIDKMNYDLLVSLIERLPIGLRKTFIMRHVEQLSIAEIAERTGRSYEAVCACLHRGFTELRSLARKERGA